MEHASSHYATANAITAIAARMAAKPLAPSPSDASCPHPRQPVNRGANKVDARGCARAWGGPWTFPNGPSGHDSLRSFGRGHPDRAQSLRGVIRFCCRHPPTRFRSSAIFRTPRLPARDSPDASANGSGYNCSARGPASVMRQTAMRPARRINRTASAIFCESTPRRRSHRPERHRPAPLQSSGRTVCPPEEARSPNRCRRPR